MLPASLFCSALVATAVAVLCISWHDCKLVTALTTIVNALPAPSARSYVPPPAGVPAPQLSTCDPTAPVIVHCGVLVVHVTPPPLGSGSLSVTPFASPGPRFVTTIVNVAVPPAVTVPPSGVFTTCSTGLVINTGSSAHG